MNNQEVSSQNVWVRWSEHLTSENEMCGRIRIINSNQCVTVLNEPDESDGQIFSLTKCDEGKIFCYNSATRFIKLQDNEMQCVAVEDDTLRLKACKYERKVWGYMSWGYMWRDTLENGSVCWKSNSDQKNVKLVVGKLCQEFDFQLIIPKEPGSPSSCA